MLRGDLKGDIDLIQPEGRVQHDVNYEKKVRELRKSLYGLKLAAHA